MKKRVRVKAWRKPPLETKDDKARRAAADAHLARSRRNDKPKSRSGE